MFKINLIKNTGEDCMGQEGFMEVWGEAPSGVDWLKPRLHPFGYNRGYDRGFFATFFSVRIFLVLAQLVLLFCGLRCCSSEASTMMFGSIICDV